MRIPNLSRSATTIHPITGTTGIMKRRARRQPLGPFRPGWRWARLGLLGALAAAAVLTSAAPAVAGKVHAETRVRKYYITRDHCSKTSGDANLDAVECYSVFDSSWAYAREGWGLTAYGYMLDSVVNSYRQSSVYRVSAHAHHHWASPAVGGHPVQTPPDVPLPGTPGTITFSHVNYTPTGRDQIILDLAAETFLQISLADLVPGESDSTALRQVVDSSVNQVTLSGKIGPEGPDVQVSRTGFFESVPYSVRPYPNQIYVLRFDAPLHFVVNATIASDLELASGDLVERPCTRRPAGMVAWWTLDEPNGSAAVSDIAGFPNDGVPMPGPQLGSPQSPGALAGVVNGAQGFIPPGYVQVQDHASLNFAATESLTIDAWVKPVLHTLMGFINYPIVAKVSGNSGYALLLPGNPNILRFWMNGVTFDSSATMAFDDWHHVAVTVDRTTGDVTLYIDGVAEVFPASPLGAATTNGVPLRIGSSQLPGATKGELHIDEVEVFNTALAPVAIQRIFSAGSGGKCRTWGVFLPHTVIHFPFRPPTATPTPVSRWTATPTDAPTSTPSHVAPRPTASLTSTPTETPTIDRPTVSPTHTPIPDRPTITPTVAAACAPQPAEMAAWWPLDELSGKAAWDVIGGNHGVVHGGAAVIDVAKVGPGRNFDGTTGLVVVPSAPALNAGAADFSIDAWINPASDAVLPIVTMQYAPADAPLGYAFYLENRQLTFTMSNEGSAVTGAAPAVLPLDRQWHLVAVTIERGSKTGGRLYVDGALVHTFDTTALVGPVEAQADLHIGEQPRLSRGGAQRFFSGGIDELELFHRALTAEEVRSVYAAGALGKCDKPPTPRATVPPRRVSNRPIEAVMAGVTLQVGDIKGDRVKACSD